MRYLVVVEEVQRDLARTCPICLAVSLLVKHERKHSRSFETRSNSISKVSSRAARRFRSHLQQARLLTSTPPNLR